jgi:hypothetical protein
MSRCSSRLILAFSVLLSLLPVAVQAQFIIEFTDGNRITVSNYKEEGQKIKIHTSEGWFAFRREDVANIIDLTTGKKARNLDSPQDIPSTSPSEMKEQAKPQIVESAPAPERSKALTKIETRPTLELLQEAASSVGTLPKFQDLFERVKKGIFEIRYVIALLLGVKVLKIFFSVGIR